MSEARNLFDDLENAPCEQDGDGWSGTVDGFCPVQGEGRVGEFWWYFRARWDDWSFDVFSAEPKWDGTSYDRFVWGTAGEFINASWMSYANAWSIIKDQIARFVTERHTEEKT